MKYIIKRHKYIKKILLLISILLISLISYNFVVASGKWYGENGNATAQMSVDRENSIGNELKLTNGYVHNSTDIPIYCISRNLENADLYGDKYNKFVVSGYVDILGKTATGRGEGKSENVSISDKSNAFLAYVLAAKGYNEGYCAPGNERVKQYSVWGNINNWSDNVGSKMGMNLYYSGNYGATYDQTLLVEANKYANSCPEQGASIDNCGISIVQVESWDKPIGPFTFSYTGEITDIIGYNKNGDKISGLKFYSDKDGKKQITDVSKITSKENFWILDSSKQLAKINAKCKATVYGVRIWWLTATESQYFQDYIYVEPYEEVTEADCDVEVKSPDVELTIRKVDYNDNKKALDGVEFILHHNNKIASKVEQEDGFDVVKEWVSDINNAYKFKTDSNGEIKIRIQRDDINLYALQEITAKDGYAVKLELASYKGIKENSKNSFINEEGDTLFFDLDENSIAELTLGNHKLISISGYVWAEKQPTKWNGKEVGGYDELFDKQNEPGLPNVKVKLVRKADGKAIEEETDSNGAYVFDKQLYKEQLKDYYVQFEYNGVKYKVNDKEYTVDSRYIPVAFNSTDKNGSRALYESIPESDEDPKYNGIVTTYAKTDDSKEKVYGLSGELLNKFYNAENDSLENINLGIKYVPETTFKTNETIEYIQIKLKGYTYTYYKDVDGIIDYQIPSSRPKTAVTVATQSVRNTNVYTQYMYPSDITYLKEEAKSDLKVYVVYRIDVTNHDDSRTNIEELYQENKLYITNITNKFDAKRYKLNDSNWKAENDGIATINSNYLKEVINNNGKGISGESTTTAEIKFEVNESAILDILNHPDGIKEDKPTNVDVTGYHTYTRKDYSWENNTTDTQNHTTKKETKTSNSVYLSFKLGKQRVLSGTVFEDNAVEKDGEVLGNGKLDNNENKVKAVKVELLDSNGKVSYTYGVNVDANGKYKPNDTYKDYASVVTDETGKYEIVGVVPGDYYLRFTYGDGTQKIVDMSGNEEAVSTKEYKSTIVTSDKAKAALKDTSIKDTKWTWYKDSSIKDGTYSVAVDDLSDTNYKAGEIMQAKTAKISVTIENNDERDIIIQVGDTQVEYFEAKGLNFGIIKKPEQKIELEKVITNIKIDNIQGNNIVDGNPQTVKAAGVTDLDGNDKNNGSTYTRVELDENSIYGSTTYITYSIRIKNVSDINYDTKGYYWFGEDKNNEIALVMDEAIDYLDSALTFEGSDNRVKTITYDIDNGWIDSEGNTITTVDENAEKTYNTLLVLKGNKTLYTANNPSRRTDGKDTTENIELSAIKKLSTEDNDLEFKNIVKVTKLNNKSDAGDNTLIRYVSEIKMPGQAQAILTITPPTGENKQEPIMYVAVAVIALVVLTGGIIVIKKKVI